MILNYLNMRNVLILNQLNLFCYYGKCNPKQLPKLKRSLSTRRSLRREEEYQKCSILCVGSFTYSKCNILRKIRTENSSAVTSLNVRNHIEDKKLSDAHELVTESL